MHVMCPADELAMIRAQLNGLRTREVELKQTLLAATDDGREGEWSRAEVVTRMMRVFDHRLLPQGVRDDPCFWREREVSEVRCLPIQPGGPAGWDAPPSVRGRSTTAQGPGSRPVHM